MSINILRNQVFAIISFFIFSLFHRLSLVQAPLQERQGLENGVGPRFGHVSYSS